MATLITIPECNQRRTSVFCDACVIVDAIKERQPTFELFTEIDFSLRLYASVTLFEVAFARRTGHADPTLKANQKWMNGHFAERVRFTDGVGRRFERFLDEDARRVRGQTDLGDVLVASWSLGNRGELAIATSNGEDFKKLPVVLVEEFLPADVAAELKRSS